MAVTESLEMLLQGQVLLSLLTSSTGLRSDASTSGYRNPQRTPYQRRAVVLSANLSILLHLESLMVSFPNDERSRLEAAYPGGALRLLVR